MGVMLKSAFLPAEAEDGLRYFVETLWPEGVDAYYLSPYKWINELSPSYYMKEKAIWKKWNQTRFKEEYFKELRQPERQGWFHRIVKEAAGGNVTLLHGSRKKPRLINRYDTTAYYLKEFIEKSLGQAIKNEAQSVQKKVEQKDNTPPIECDEKKAERKWLDRWGNEGGQ